MSDVSFSPDGPPETVLPDPTPELAHRLDQAQDTRALSAVVADHPTSPAGWAALAAAVENADGSPDIVSAYAFYRVGYHRGLDALRANGWRGSGYVRSEHPGNRGFLDCLAGLARMADVIGETDEAERCRTFLTQLDPTGKS